MCTPRHLGSSVLSYVFGCLPVPPFFFLLTRPPPRSTLFPYTTLFRSWGASVRSAGGPAGGFGPKRRGASDRRDRKSTRLNSSHTVISYAVFCLKKKKRWNCGSTRRF